MNDPRNISSYLFGASIRFIHQLNSITHTKPAWNEIQATATFLAGTPLSLAIFAATFLQDDEEYQSQSYC